MEFNIIKPKNNFIVRSEIKRFIHEKNMRFSAKIIKQLNKSLEGELLKAVERAKQNKRKTILPQDCI